jgi:hypothetical protein
VLAPCQRVGLKCSSYRFQPGISSVHSHLCCFLVRLSPEMANYHIPPRAGTGANTQNRYSLGIKMQLRLLLAANLYSDLVMLLLLIMTIICFVCFLCSFVWFCMLWKRELSVEIFRIGNYEYISQLYELSEIISSSLLKRTENTTLMEEFPSGIICTYVHTKCGGLVDI